MFEHCQDMINMDRGVMHRKVYTRIVARKDEPEPGRVYVNSAAHPELQKLDDYGFRTVLMKQLEINEQLLREILAELKRR